jgi:hypothetical protein
MAGEGTTMDPNKVRSVVWIGSIGGVATIVGVALPWLSDTTPGSGGSINGLITGPWVLIFGVIMAAGSLFLLADGDTRKVVAILGPVSLAVVVYVAPIIINKEAGLFGGLTDGSTTERGIGLYVCLLGGILGLVAAGIGAKELMSPTPSASGATRFDLGDVSSPAADEDEV